MRNLVDYLLKSKKHLCFLALFTLVFSSLVIAQTRVTGKVTGPDGKPVFGATIGVKGTNVATTSTTDGSYAVTLPHNSTVLVFSYIGFEVSEVNVRGNNVIDVAMKLQTTSLNEVVVTGYTAQRKKDITGSVSVVNVAQMKQSPVGTGEEALQGRASGLKTAFDVGGSFLAFLLLGAWLASGDLVPAAIAITLLTVHTGRIRRQHGRDRPRPDGVLGLALAPLVSVQLVVFAQINPLRRPCRRRTAAPA